MTRMPMRSASVKMVDDSSGHKKVDISFLIYIAKICWEMIKKKAGVSFSGFDISHEIRLRWLGECGESEFLISKI